MKKLIFTGLFMAILGTNVFSQKIVRLYDGAAPGSEGWNYNEIEYTSPWNGKKMVRNVVNPTLEVYLPEKSEDTGSAVVVCPGGGFVWLSYQSEGTEVAEWLAKNGIAAFVLKYRLNETPESTEEFDDFVQGFFSRMLVPTDDDKSEDTSESPGPAETDNTILAGKDGLRAVEYVREHAQEYGINPEQVGIMGFSAGAAVTMNVILNSIPENQPNFAAPIYGGWLRGANVPENAPPLFILAAADDQIAAGCPSLFQAWRDAGLSAELFISIQKADMDSVWIKKDYLWIAG